MFQNFVQMYLVMSEQYYDKERAEHGNGSHDEYWMVGLVLPEHVRRDRHWNGEGHGAGRDQAEINKGISSTILQNLYLSFYSIERPY